MVTSVSEEVMLGSCPDYIYFLTHGGQGGIGCNSKMTFVIRTLRNLSRLGRISATFKGLCHEISTS